MESPPRLARTPSLVLQQLRRRRRRATANQRLGGASDCRNGTSISPSVSQQTATSDSVRVWNLNSSSNMAGSPVHRSRLGHRSEFDAFIVFLKNDSMNRHLAFLHWLLPRCYDALLPSRRTSFGGTSAFHSLCSLLSRRLPRLARLVAGCLQPETRREASRVLSSSYRPLRL